MGFSLGMGMGMLGVVVEKGIEGMIIGDGCGLVLLLSRLWLSSCSARFSLNKDLSP